MSKVSRGFKDFRPMKDGLMGILDLINGDESLGHWVTINGVHVLIHEGESVEEAFKRQTGKTVEGKPEVKNIEQKIELKAA
ncbi:MAG: hypothetical protein QG670_897, partial [Thermoproteota archaeon]|nr:hypothetical protein [Thermoproteota archaeon]